MTICANCKAATRKAANYKARSRRRSMAANNAKTSPAASTAEREVVITRVFDAPRELVFKAFTERERLMRWWGPGGFTTPLCELDVRPGGAIFLHMRAPDGTIYPMAGVY